MRENSSFVLFGFLLFYNKHVCSLSFFNVVISLTLVCAGLPYGLEQTEMVSVVGLSSMSWMHLTTVSNGSEMASTQQMDNGRIVCLDI